MTNVRMRRMRMRMRLGRYDLVGLSWSRVEVEGIREFLK